MYTEKKLPLYIGITDFENADQVMQMAKLIPESHRRKLMVGVMMSRKTFHGIPTKWAKVWKNPHDVKDVFIDHPKVLNTLHWADYDDRTEFSDFYEVVRSCCGKNLHAIQLDMIWPDPMLVMRLKGLADIPIILQVGKNSLDHVANNPEKLFYRIEKYDGSIDGILLDKSMGHGVGMNAKVLRPFVEEISSSLPKLHIAVAGGLGPKSLYLVEPLMKDFPDLSIDAQGQLRPSGNAMDPIDWSMAGEYVSKAFAQFS